MVRDPPAGLWRHGSSFQLDFVTKRVDAGARASMGRPLGPERKGRQMELSTRDHYVTFGRREGDEDFPNSLISGISTFLGARVVPPVREDLEREGVKAGVLGLPWEHTNTCRPGASYGPRSIRRATEHYLSYHGE